MAVLLCLRATNKKSGRPKGLVIDVLRDDQALGNKLSIDGFVAKGGTEQEFRRWSKLVCVELVGLSSDDARKWIGQKTIDFEKLERRPIDSERETVHSHVRIKRQYTDPDVMSVIEG